MGICFRLKSLQEQSVCKTHRKVYTAPCFAYVHMVGHKRFLMFSGLKAGGGWGEGAAPPPRSKLYVRRWVPGRLEHLVCVGHTRFKADKTKVLVRSNERYN